MAIKFFDIASLVGNDTTIPVKYEDKVIYNVRDKVIKTGEGEYDFVIEQEVYEESRVDRDEFIESFSDEVGIENILKKVALTGDQTLLNQCNPNYVDTRNMPTNMMEADDIVSNGLAKAKESGVTLSEEGIKAYIDSELSKIKVANETSIVEEKING